MPSPVQSQHIQTSTDLKLIEDNANAWEDFAGDDIVGDTLYWTAPSGSPYDYQNTHWSYRGQASMCKPKRYTGMAFDGVDDYITFGDNYDYAATADFDVSVWIKWNGGAGTILSKMSASGGNGWQIYIDSSGYVKGSRSDGTTTGTVTASQPITTGDWHLVAFSYWGGGTTLYMLVDDQAYTAAASAQSLPGNTANLTVGRDAYGSSGYFNGSMWLIILWTTSPSLLYLYNGGNDITGKQFSDRAVSYGGVASRLFLNQESGDMLDSTGSLAGTVNGSPTRGVDGPFDTYSIERVRIGDGSSSDRQIYEQTIIDPTDPAEWESWSLLYSGTWYAVALGEDPSQVTGYRLYHASSTHIYADNNAKITVSNVVKLRPVVNGGRALYYCTVSQSSDGKRIMEWFHTTDGADGGVTPKESVFNYDWAHADLIAYQVDTDFQTVFHSCPYFANNSRSQTDSDGIVQEWQDITTTDEIREMTINSIRGASARAGIKQFHDLYLTDTLGDGLVYLFYSEDHRDPDSTNSLQNIRRPLVWQRANDIVDSVISSWSEPTPAGFSVWGFAGVIRTGDYIYVAGNGRVLRRLADPTEIDLSNYVLSGQVSIPRENQKATGGIRLTNPENAVGDLLGIAAEALSVAPEKRVDLQLGQQRFLDEGYTWDRCNDWWVSNTRRVRDQKTRKDELTLELADFWHRLENKFRDTYYYPGWFNKRDWHLDGDNVLSNWFSPKGATLTRTAETSGDDSYYYMTVPSGKALYTVWKGHSFYNLSASFQMGTHGATYLLFRWVDGRNYYRVRYQTSTVYLEQVRNGAVTSLTSAAAGSTSSTSFSLKVTAYFDLIKVYFNGSLKITHRITTHRRFQGHVGVWSAASNLEVRDFVLQDVEAETTTANLLRYALGYAGYLWVDISEELNNIQQLDTLWGPQTDIETPADAISKLLKSNNLQMVCKWVADTPWIYIDQFSSADPDYSLTDEILEYTQVEEAEKRPNVVMVDGNEHSWTEFYRPDLVARGKTVTEYLDLPELLTQGAVKDRAGEVLDRAIRGNSPGGKVIWRPGLQRLDVVSWTDEFGDVWAMQIEGLKIAWDQGLRPFQHAEIDGGPLLICTDEPVTHIVSDSFTREIADGWGTADTGGAWTVDGTAANWDVTGGVGTIVPAAGSSYTAYLGTVSETDVSARLKASVDKDWADGLMNVAIILRRVDANNLIMGYVQLNTTGSINLRIRKILAGVSSVVSTAYDFGLSLEVGQEFMIQMQADGTAMRLKAWLATEPEPSEYQLETSITDSALQAAGSVGIRVFLDGSGTNHPVTYSIDDLEAW